jgi:hypothetical protein
MFRLAAQRIKAQYGLAGPQRFSQAAAMMQEKGAILIRAFRGDVET